MALISQELSHAVNRMIDDKEMTLNTFHGPQVFGRVIFAFFKSYLHCSLAFLVLDINSGSRVNQNFEATEVAITSSMVKSSLSIKQSQYSPNKPVSSVKGQIFSSVII